MTKYVLAHDLGTSGNKATLFSDEGMLVGSSVYSYETKYNNNSLWVEQNSEDWWQAVCETTKNISQSCNVAKENIAAISFSGQMMGCLCVDKKGNALRNAIIWADQRAQKQAEQIGSHISMKDFYKITGHRNTASYGLQKLMWIRDNEPYIYENTYKTLNAKDFIVFKLTGKFYTDYSDATGNNCMDIRKLEWAEQIIEYAGIDIDKFPEIKPSTFIAGGVTHRAAEECGLLEGTPVVIGGGDGVCANVGAGSYKEGKTFSYVGSSSWVATTTDQPLFDEEMRTITWAHIVPGLYAPNGTMQTAGGAYNWIKNAICQYETEIAKESAKNPYDIINQEAEQSSAGANGVVFLPYLLGERAPRWNPAAKGAFVGLKMNNNHNDLLRSVLEGITMNLCIILDAMRSQVKIDEIVVIGGGAKGELWRQIMADVYNITIKVPRLLEEATSMGAAITGGVGVGLFKDFDVIERFIDIDSIYTPNLQDVEIYKKSKLVFDECYDSLKSVFGKM